MTEGESECVSDKETDLPPAGLLPVWSSIWVAETHVLEPSFAASHDILAGSWIKTARIQISIAIRDANSPSSILTHWTTTPVPYQYLLERWRCWYLPTCWALAQRNGHEFSRQTPKAGNWTGKNDTNVEVWWSILKMNPNFKNEFP